MSDESLRKAGRAELDRLNRAKPGAMSDKESRKAKPPRYKSKGFVDDVKGLVGIGKAKERRTGTGETVTEAVDRAVKNAKPDPY